MPTRVLAHRIRGFGRPEGSLGALSAAINADVRLVEVDTRHTADEQIVVHHSPCLGSITTGSGLIAGLHSEEVFKQRFLRQPDECLASLEAFLQTARQVLDLELWIDIKDFGLERKYVELVKEYGIQDRVRLISWIPETVIRLRQLDPAVPIGFSYSCLAHRGTYSRWLRKLAKFFAIQGKPLVAWWRHGAMSDVLRTIPFVHPLDREIGEQPDSSLEVGFNHAHFIPGLPDGRLMESLKYGVGAVGMFASQATEGVVRRAHELGLLVYVYTVNSDRHFRNVRQRAHVDVVFSDNATHIGVVNETADCTL